MNSILASSAFPSAGGLARRCRKRRGRGLSSGSARCVAFDGGIMANLQQSVHDQTLVRRTFQVSLSPPHTAARRTLRSADC